jgi:MFS transporter, DHA1 family, multidrug resistance protein
VATADLSPQRDGGFQKISLRVILADPAVRIVMLIVFVVILGFGIIAPILPLYARSFGVDYGAASLLISAFAFTRLLFDPIGGPLIDRFGERLVSMTGVVIVGVSSVLTAIAPTFVLAVVFRGAGGAGSSILFAALYSYMLKVVPPDRMGRTMSVFYGTFNVGIIAGGPLGGLIAHAFSLNTPLYVYAGLCFAAGILYLRFLQDPSPRELTTEQQAAVDAGGPMWRRTRTEIHGLFKNRAFVTVVILNMAFFWVVAGGYDTLLPLFAKEGLGLSTVGVGFAFTMAVVAEFLVLYPAGTASDRLGRKPVVTGALIGLAAMVLVAGWAATPWVLFAFMFLMGLCSGSAAAAPAAMLSDIVSGGSGTAVGVFRFFGDLGFVFGPLVAGVSAKAWGFKVGFGLMAAPVLFALVLVLRTPETLRRGPAVVTREAREVQPFGRPPTEG